LVYTWVLAVGVIVATVLAIVWVVAATGGYAIGASIWLVLCNRGYCDGLSDRQWLSKWVHVLWPY
jgi:hypothetical protein